MNRFRYQKEAINFFLKAGNIRMFSARQGKASQPGIPLKYKKTFLEGLDETVSPAAGEYKIMVMSL